MPTVQVTFTRLLSTTAEKGADGLPVPKAVIEENTQSERRNLLERILPKYMLPYAQLMRLHAPIGACI